MDLLNGLYDYQVEAVEAIQNNNNGIICIFTGGGKTRIASVVLADDIVKHKNEFRIYLVNVPRILLSYQILTDVYSFLIKNNIESRYMFVHSGRGADEKELEEIRLHSNVPYSEIKSTLSHNGIQDIMQKAKNDNLPLIIFSTYNSASSVELVRQKMNANINMMINDEAHFLVQEQFNSLLHIIKSERSYYFTATMSFTPSNNGRGMNNQNMYGNVIYKKTPLDAILMGKMVRPRLHMVTTDGIYNTDDYNKSLNKIIYDTFIQHKDVLKETNQSPKLLISTKGTQDIRGFMRSSQYRTLINNNVDIYIISSLNEIGCRINDKSVNRTDFLKELKRNGEIKEKELIVLHYDILAEGIDVSGFTGIMPLRTLSKSKFLQTFGRCARPDKEDRKRIDSGELYVNDLKNFNKPYAYVIIPNIIHNNQDDKENMVQLINELRNYNFNPSEDIMSSSLVHGIPKHEVLNGLNEINVRIPNLGTLIQNLNADIEASYLADLSITELLKQIN